MSDTGVAAKPRRALDAQFPGQRFVVFYQEGDGPGRDISETVGFLSGKQALLPPKRYAPTPDGAAAGTPTATGAAGSAEFLRVEVCGSGGGGGGGGLSSPSTALVSLWAVGRVSLRVEARSFDGDLGEDRREAAAAAFMAFWALRMQVSEGINQDNHTHTHNHRNRVCTVTGWGVCPIVDVMLACGQASDLLYRNFIKRRDLTYLVGIIVVCLGKQQRA